MKNLFTFSGRIGSGKSAVSKEFARRIGADWQSFGGTVRKIAVELRIEPTRKALQDLGATLVQTDPASLCRRVIETGMRSKSDYVVIDGLRHLRVLEELRALVGVDALRSIFVQIPERMRLERVWARDGLDASTLASLETHSTEEEVIEKLRLVADFVADNSESVDRCVLRILDWAKSGLPQTSETQRER